MKIEDLNKGKDLVSEIEKAKSDLMDIRLFGVERSFSLSRGDYNCSVPLEINETLVTLVEMQLEKNLKSYEKQLEEL